MGKKRCQGESCHGGAYLVRVSARLHLCMCQFVYVCETIFMYVSIIGDLMNTSQKIMNLTHSL